MPDQEPARRSCRAGESGFDSWPALCYVSFFSDCASQKIGLKSCFLMPNQMKGPFWWVMWLTSAAWSDSFWILLPVLPPKWWILKMNRPCLWISSSWLCNRAEGGRLPLQKGCCPRGWERKQVHCGVNKGLRAHQRASAHQLMVVYLLNKCSHAAPLCPVLSADPRPGYPQLPVWQCWMPVPAHQRNTLHEEEQLLGAFLAMMRKLSQKLILA